jgi:hypothetical protein
MNWWRVGMYAWTAASAGWFALTTIMVRLATIDAAVYSLLAASGCAIMAVIWNGIDKAVSYDDKG